MNTRPIDSPGFGLGLRTAHYQDFLTAPQRVDWLEIITDNFLVDGGKPLVMLDTIRRDYPIAMHGVAMSIGSVSGLDLAYLSRVKQLAQRVEPMWISDHLCWTGFGDNVLHDLYPLPYTEECARLLIAQIRQAQDVLERRLVIENVSSYVRFSASTALESTFLAYVLNEADCDLLLDVNNVFVSSLNHGFSAQAYLDDLPAARVRQMHLAGHSRAGDHIIDTHDHPVAPEVWALYAHACRRFPNVATMIERDDNIPALPELIAELDQARAIAALQPPLKTTTAAHDAANWRSTPSELHIIQQRLAEYILDDTPFSLPAAVDAGGSLPGEKGMRIYHRAYRERLSEVLADSYAKCALYVGTELFKELAYRYVDLYPPKQRNLGRYGAHFSALLAISYPENHELSDLAQLEWALRDVFDQEDVPAWTLPAVQEAGAEACLQTWPIRHPSMRLLPVRTNAMAIWRAIDADDDVPEVLRFEQVQNLAVWRKGLQPHFRSLEPAEAQFLQQLEHEGATIGAVAQQWGEEGRLEDPATLANWLASWWSDELLRRAAS